MKVDYQNCIQIAGIIDQNEADLVIQSGVQFLGFPLRLPVHKEDLSEEEASKIINNLPDPAKGVLITYLDNADEIVELLKKIGAGIVQLHGEIELSELKKLRNILPEVSIIKSLVIRKNNESDLISIMKSLENQVDAFITDTFDPSTGASGATGKTHNWEISKKINDLTDKPLILAGGLNPENVYKSITEVKPAGVDSHTGVEDPDGRKSQLKLMKFVSEAQRAFNEIGR